MVAVIKVHRWSVRDPEAATAEPVAAEPAKAPVELPPPPPAKTQREVLLEKLDAWPTLTQAIEGARPLMEDTTNDLSQGTITLAFWSARHLTRAELDAQPETKRGLVMKDAAAERGKRLCVTGAIGEISADRSAADIIGTLYIGGIVRNYTEVTRFVAVGDTGNLVQNSRARFCGIVTGRYSYNNAGGGVTHAPMVVGMFELANE